MTEPVTNLEFWTDYEWGEKYSSPYSRHVVANVVQVNGKGEWRPRYITRIRDRQHLTFGVKQRRMTSIRSSRQNVGHK